MTDHASKEYLKDNPPKTNECFEGILFVITCWGFVGAIFLAMHISSQV